MKEEWLTDARKIPDEVMSYIRKISVRAIEEKEYSPELIADVLGISRTAIYDWKRRYCRGGYSALDTQISPGAPPVITEEMDAWLIDTVLNHSPLDFEYDTALWTRDILAALLNKHFDINVAGFTVSLHLNNLGLSYQKPWFRANERDELEVKQFLNEKFPRIQRLAEKLGADIAFEDEAGVGLQTHSGKTWGQIGKTPEVPVTGKRGGYNLLSIVTADGIMRFSIQESNIKSKEYIEFLKTLIKGRERTLILIVDRASFHKSKDVRMFVRSRREKIRIYFLPRYSPEMNPDEQVWNEVKSKKIGRKAIKTKKLLKKALYSELRSLQKKTEKIKSFFQVSYTQYAAA